MATAALDLNPLYLVMYEKVQVFRRLSSEEVLRIRADPTVTFVGPYEGTTHYYPDCEASPPYTGLSRALTDTTCRVCLQLRANELAGWRWVHPFNAEEISFLLAQGIQPTIPGDTEKPPNV